MYLALLTVTVCYFTVATHSLPLHPINHYASTHAALNRIAFSSGPVKIWYQCVGTIPNFPTLFTTCNWSMILSKGEECPIAKPSTCNETNFCSHLVPSPHTEEEGELKWELAQTCYYPNKMSLPARR